MKSNYLLYFSCLLLLFTACDDLVDVKLDEQDPFMVVDAWLTHTDSTQKIILTYTQPYFNNNSPSTALGAMVEVRDLDTDEVFSFTDEDGDGTYTWIPAEGTPFGTIGHSYHLNVLYQGVTYSATSHMDSVPAVDSITFEYNKKDGFFSDDYYIGEFWARDLPGLGNTYWIKTWKNGELLDDPDQINVAYDAGFSAGSEVDSLIFIQPIRTAINPFEEDEEDDDVLSPPYIPGDSAYVEIHAITNDAWFFLSRVAEETNRPGGFAELFATPLANVPTNIASSDENTQVVGFFSVASVSALGVRVSEATIRDDDPD